MALLIPPDAAAIGSMSPVENIVVGAEDGGSRLDRWFRRRYPTLGHGRLEKLLRTGQVRVDGKRASSGQRLEPGQTVRVPPLDLGEAEKPPVIVKASIVFSAADVEALQAAIVHIDDAVIAIDKPAGLAVQGGSGLTRNLDAMLDALRFGKADRPRLVHRLDRDTSGVLLLARDAATATFLTAAFRGRETRKLYWAMVVGVPSAASGRIDLPLSKEPGRHGERMEADRETGKSAITDYTVVDRAGNRVAWLAMEPRTGRTHQLRAHAVAIGTPILGDGKYGGPAAFLPGGQVGRRLHLHARAIRVPHPAGGVLEATAPLPAHMRETWDLFGFAADAPAVFLS